MADYMQTRLLTNYPNTPLKICPVVATYPTGAVKKSWTEQNGLSAEEKGEYTCGVTLSTAAKSWTQGGIVGVVTLSLSSALA
jgi:hypothetical protein